MNSTGTSTESDRSSSEDFERQSCRLQKIAELVCQDALALRVLARQVIFPMLSKCGHGAGNCVVQTEIENMKVGRADGHIRFNRELRNDLANVSVPMHNLPDGKTTAQQLVTVERRAEVDVRMGHALRTHQV